MTMAEMLKNCTQHESSSSSLASKLGPQMVGFLSVLAISGSVAFISLMGKGMLIRQDSWTTHSQGDLHSQGGFEGEKEEGGFEGEKEEEEAHIGDSEEEKLHTHSHLDSSCDENEHSPTHLESLHDPTKATLKMKKKVRFAPDVVEPSCNGQQYRSKWRVSQACDKHEPPCNDQVLEPSLNHHHYKSKRRVSHPSDVVSNDRVYVDESPSNDQQCKSTCNVSQGYKRHPHLTHPKMPSKSCKASQGREIHAHLSHPQQVPSKSSSSIPANRLALYKGLRQSRLQHSLHRL